MMRKPIKSNFYQCGGLKGLIRRLLGFHLGQFYIYPPRTMSKSALYNKPDQYRSGLKISLVTPVLNQAEFIGQAIESVLSQEFPALEYIVMDGGSKDGTIRIIEKYRDHLTYCESAEDGGQSEAINKGFSYASGDILAWLNADDLLLPGTLDYIANFFAMNPSIDVVYGNRIVINAEGKDIGRWILPPHSNRILSWIDYVPQETLFWRRNIWDRVGGNVDTSFQFAMDWDLLVRFRECGACFFHLPIYIGAFRVHPSQKTHSQMNEIGLREMNKIRNRCLGYIPSKMAIRFAVMPYVIRHIICNWRDRLDQPFDCKTLKLLDLN